MSYPSVKNYRNLFHQHVVTDMGVLFPNKNPWMLPPFRQTHPANKRSLFIRLFRKCKISVLFIPLDSVVWYGVYSLLEGGTAMESLSIGQVARRAGVGVETVRFYEREGLLEEPPRRASGYRQYSEQAIKRIHFIKRAQQLGFSLKEITELLMLRVDAQTSCEEV